MFLSNLETLIRRYGSQKQVRILLKNIGGSVLVKILALTVSFFTMPVYLSYFENKTLLGICLTLLSAFNWILMFDFGIGNSLRNKLVIPLHENNHEEIKRYISSAGIAIGGISAVILLVGLVAAGIIDWNSFFKIPEKTVAPAVLCWAARILFFGIVLQFFLKLIPAILYAMQRIVVINFLTLCSTVLILTCLLIFRTPLPAINLILFSLIQAMALNLPLLVMGMVLFRTVLKESLPGWRFFSGSHAKAIISLGGSFFAIQVALLFLNSINEIIIAKVFTTSAVVEYSIYRKIFQLILFFFTILTQPTWAAISQAWAEKRMGFIRKIYWLFNGVAITAFIFCVIVAFHLQWLIDLWLREAAIPINRETALWFAAETGVTMLVFSTTVISNGVSRLRCQLICTIGAAACKIPVTLLLIPLLDDWNCVVAANVIVLLPMLIAMWWSTGLFLKKSSMHISADDGTHT